MKEFDQIKADEALKKKTLEAAKAGKKVKKETHIVRWSVLSGVAALLVVSVGVTAAWAGGLFSRPIRYGKDAINGSPSSDIHYDADYSSFFGGLTDGFTGGYDYYASSSESAPGAAYEAPADAPVEGVESYASKGTAEAPVPEPREGDGEGAVEEKPYQAGMLTASRLNDNVRYDEYLRVWNNAQRTEDAFGMNAIHRVAVTVRNGQHEPLYNAQVTALGQGQEVGFRARSDAQGKAYLFYDWSRFGRGSGRPVEVQVTYGGQSVTVPVGEEDEVTVTVNAARTSGTALDMMFMIDTTGSMDDELKYLKVETESLIKNLQTRLDTRISMNFYRDLKDEYVVRSFDFTDSVSEAVTQIRAQSAKGGDDWPEAVELALKNAVSAHEWRDDAVKVVFLVLDAPAHTEESVMATLAVTIQSAAEQGIRIVPVIASGAEDTTEQLCRHLALYTGGQFVFLTDDSGFGASHHAPATETEYEVKPLIQVLAYILTEYTDF